MTRKTSLIIRLIVLILSFFLLSGFFMFLFLQSAFFPHSLAQEGDLSEQGKIYSFADIEQIEVELLSASILIREADVQDVRVVDNSTGNVQHELFVDGNRLRLHSLSNRWFGLFDFPWTATSGGEFLVEVPRNKALAYDVDVVNGTVSLDVLTKENVHIESVNGDVEVMRGGENVDIETVNGHIQVHGAYEKATFESVSGDVFAVVAENSREVNANTVSGDIHIELTAVPNYNIEMDSVSGDVENHYEEEILILENDALQIEIDSVSGDLILDDWR